MIGILTKKFISVACYRNIIPTAITSCHQPLVSIFVKRNLCSEATSTTMPNKSIKNPLVWIDLEMTGLDEMNDRIMEIAVLITDGDLNTVAEGPNLIIHQDDALLENMNSWCIRQHGETGLTKACKESQCPLAGNSIHTDRKFLARYMPRIDQYLHYRLVDVSSVKELCKAWYPEEYENSPEKYGNHRALGDIRCSVEELKYYREHIFKPTN
ncbi:hypothetical protein B566_EDAN012612 [Ephemera danica]|nr:hypothetical protein B566_EDAN012612 [Ephemera danica]